MSDPSRKLPVTAAVLAGGRSMRMGVDKVMLSVDGEPLVRRVVEAAVEACEEVLVVTNRPEAMRDAGLPEGVRVLVDEVAHQGPLGGLVTALKESANDWVLALAADMPWLNADIARALWDVRDGGKVVMPVGEKGPEPLLALYHRDCLPVARRILDSGRRRLVALRGELPMVEVPVDSLRAVDPDLRSLVNINTPQELAEVREESSEDAVEREVRMAVVEVGGTRGRGMPSERPITVHMNEVEVATVQATPADLEEMAVGFLLAEGLMSDRDAFVSVEADNKRGLVWVSTDESVPDDMVYKKRYVTSGCGKGITFSTIGQARGLEKVSSQVKVRAEDLYALMGAMARGAVTYRDTGGTHACGLARGGEVLIVREDVGRHNALDKLLGRAWLDRVPTTDAVLLSTGRISYEMAVKAAKSRVPVVVSRTAVTDLAAEIADELGLTLVGYARGGKLNVYTHPERVVAEEEAS